MESVDVPVLIVGGGGCGLSASVFLSEQGTDHLLVERHDSTSLLPKAHYLNQRTMEIFRQYGVDGPVRAVAAEVGQFGVVRWQTTLGGDGPRAGQVVAELPGYGGGPLRERYEAAGPVLGARLPQIRLEPILREQAEKRNPGRVLFGHEMLRFEQHDEGITAAVRCRDTGEIMTVRAKFLIAADGGRSVGPALGAVLSGPPGQTRVTTAYLRADLSSWWRPGSLLTFFLAPDDASRFCAMVEMGPEWGKDCREWILSFTLADPDRLDDEAVRDRIREVLDLPELDLELVQLTQWTMEALVADRYRWDRVFLAGDAAHRQPPAVGLGLNSGIQDVHNLAWKMTNVVTGRAGDTLLDSYETERRPVAVENVDWADQFTSYHHTLLGAVGLGPQVPPGHREAAFSALLAPTPMGAAVRARTAELLAGFRGISQSHDLEVGFTYESGAVVPDGSPAPPRAALRDVYHPTSRPGHRLPHAWLERGGRRSSTVDLVGRRSTFVLITGPDGAAWSDLVVRAGLGDEVTVAVVGDRPSDGGYLDVHGRWAATGAPGPAGAVLVRPDNHVAWRAVGIGCSDPTWLRGIVDHLMARDGGDALR